MQNTPTKIIIQEMSVAYLQGKSTVKLSKEYGFSTTTIKKYLNLNDIDTSRNQKYYADHNPIDCFENIDTEAKAYWLGFILADGCIYKNQLIISIQEEDGYLLEDLSKLLGVESIKLRLIKKINERYKNQLSLNISNSKLIADLAKYGIISNKSHKSYFPDIPEELYSHFIRGVFDGDGSISRPKKAAYHTFNICGNNLLIEKIQEILIKNCKLNKTKLSIPKKEHANIKVVIYSGNRQCLKIKEFIYKNATIYMKRKKDKFDSIVVVWKTENNVEALKSS